MVVPGFTLAMPVPVSVPKKGQPMPPSQDQPLLQVPAAGCSRKIRNVGCTVEALVKLNKPCGLQDPGG